MRISLGMISKINPTFPTLKGRALPFMVPTFTMNGRSYYLSEFLPTILLRGRKSPTFAKNLLPLQKISYLYKKSPTFTKNLLPSLKFSYLCEKIPIPLLEVSYLRIILLPLPIPTFPNVPILLGSELWTSCSRQCAHTTKTHTHTDTHIFSRCENFRNGS